MKTLSMTLVMLLLSVNVLARTAAEEAQYQFQELIHGPVMEKAGQVTTSYDEEVRSAIMDSLFSFSGSYLQFVDSFCHKAEGCRLRQFANVTKSLNAFLADPKSGRKDLILALREPVSLEEICGNLSSRSQTLACEDAAITKKEKELETLVSREKYEAGINMATDYSAALGFIESRGSFKSKEVIDSYYFQLLHYAIEQSLMVQQ
ncbi:hypothetical protein [Bdellovibrio reynosensis]|uniref:Secreted protein n=1 Tax=Bdellovibrio reynosensis TaxID=2835041 RepID=A0ABY4CCT2_9BACT|nr:hypothetical protein [Bdellovibrio reynosensis]UOF02529.1 hypothetical protein MNR06_06135 [Bdellovibrio reynosensis]